MKRKEDIFLALLLTICLSFNVVGQESKPTDGKLVITGSIFDSETREPLPNAYFSINEKPGYVANELGRFLIKGNPGDKITYSYLGYANFEVQIPDTLAAVEYLVGIFMTKDTIMIPEVVIFPRTTGSSIVTQVNVDAQMLGNAQANVDKAVVQGLTQPVKEYDADMNAKRTMRVYQMRAQNKGLLVTPENSVGISTQSYRTYNMMFGSPIIHSQRVIGELVTQTETEAIIGQYVANKQKLDEPKPDDR